MRRFTILVVAAMVMLGAFAFSGAATPVAEAQCDTGAAEHIWSGTVISYGIRTFTVSFCGPDSLDLYAGVSVNSHKNVTVAVVEPDGTVHSFFAGGNVSGPLDHGDWTVVVRNNTPSNVRFTAELETF